MSDEWGRLKAKGSTVVELKVIKAAGKCLTQLKALRQSLRDCIDEGRFPAGRDAVACR
jgi:hypothetical protein